MRTVPISQVESPSGKDADYENFPVGSWLISPRLRSHVHIFYHFARVIDDVADNSFLTPEEKLVRLSGFHDAIDGFNSDNPDFIAGHRMRSSLIETNSNPKHCFDLIKAFKQDVVKNRYQNWEELIDYCLLSAAPVGRYLLDLHGESADKYFAADALCSALQVLNHLQDCKDDFYDLNRIYLPLAFFKEEAIVYNALKTQRSCRNFRLGIEKILSSTNTLIKDAKSLPRSLLSRRLSMETQSIINIADKLSKKLSENDPLLNRIKLTKTQYLFCCILGGIKGLVLGTKFG